MTKTLLLMSLMLIGAATRAADEIEPLDADFLEYLANLEADDDNWTLLDDSVREPPGEDSEQAPPAERPAARKSSKEAAKPAVEER